MQHNILKNKYYLYLTEFFAGMSVMAVELGASRLLAPYFSSSQIVWTIIIGTIMIAMALGNVWGGRRADKDPNPDKLYVRLVVAAVWIAAIPLLGKYVILAISGVLVLTVNTNFLIWAAFLACMVIFVFPLFLLGTVTPSLARYTVDSLTDSGKTVGALGAFNTIGSIIGTFLPTFVTIPAVGTAVTFLIFSGILLALALVYFISTKAKPVTCTVGVLAFLFCSIFGHSGSFAFWETDLVYEGESVYNYLQVKGNDRRVVLSTNVLFGVQSVLNKDAGLTFWETDLVYEGESVYNYLQVKGNDRRVVLSTNVLFGVQSVLNKDAGLTGMYYDYALAAPLMGGVMEKESPKVLILGMGTGTFAKQCQDYFGDVEICGVEIDEKITELAHEYFELSPDIPVVTYDGRAYLNAVTEKYDVIMVDAYQDITIPFQMSTQEFFALVKEHLTDDGVMVVNMNMHTEEEGNINQYLSDTIAGVFPEVYTVDVPGTTNRELFAAMGEGSLEKLSAGAEELASQELREMMVQVAGALKSYEKGGYLLTDDKAPVELLGYYREIFQEKGIKGVLEAGGF